MKNSRNRTKLNKTEKLVLAIIAIFMSLVLHQSIEQYRWIKSKTKIENNHE